MICTTTVLETQPITSLLCLKEKPPTMDYILLDTGLLNTGTLYKIV